MKKFHEENGFVIRGEKKSLIHYLEDQVISVGPKTSHNKTSPRYRQAFWVINCSRYSFNVYNDIVADEVIENLKKAEFVGQRYQFRCLKWINTYQLLDFKKI